MGTYKAMRREALQTLRLIQANIRGGKLRAMAKRTIQEHTALSEMMRESVRACLERGAPFSIIAGPAHVWLCGSCGKTSSDRIPGNTTSGRGWDTSCFTSAQLVLRSSLVFDADGHVTGARAVPVGTPYRRIRSWS